MFEFVVVQYSHVKLPVVEVRLFDRLVYEVYTTGGWASATEDELVDRAKELFAIRLMRVLEDE